MLTQDPESSVSDNGHTLPIIQKVIDLSSKIHDLKKEHAVLSDQVKQSTSSFPDPEILKTLQQLSTEHEVLKKKYAKESSERKQLYNEVIELKGNIRVFCRCRPINQNEVSNGCNSVVEFDSSIENELQVVCTDTSRKQFKFDHVFKPEDNQEAVFTQTKPIVTSVLDGYNVCIFAYGQTGTGKTFTMEGTPESRGVNYRTVEELFRISEERSGVMRYAMSVSMLEVYNEKIRDLLVDNSGNQQAKKLEIKQSAEGTQEVPGLVEACVFSIQDVWEQLKSGSRGLQVKSGCNRLPDFRLEIKQSAEGTQEVPGLVEARVFSIQDVWEQLKSGSRVRSVGSTSANEMSSRSHCLLRVTVKGENLINGQSTKSHLWLVDLAGSERVGRIEVEGERLKESQFINKSLSALGDVIAALASKTAHVPYRNSKLTHILQSSLGGDCKTLMFVQISPSSSDLGETICSLNFATRVRGIEGGPARKQSDLSELFKYKQMAEKFKHDEKETRKLQDSMQSMQLRLATREHICKNLQDKVRDLENQLAEERKTRLKQESRAYAVTSAPSSSAMSSQKQKTMTEKKPPLAPKPRMPLRRITNMLPPPSPLMRKEIPSLAAADGKENITKMAARSLLQPRRISMAAVRATPSSSSFLQNFKPRRRVSIAALPLRPEPSSSSSYMTTPLQSSASRFNSSGAHRQSMVRDPRKPRCSNRWFFPSLPETNNTMGGGGEMMTPVAARRSSSKFMGSPPSRAPHNPRLSQHHNHHPAALALQKKSVVWSPLKLLSMKQQFNRRPSLLPTRSSGTEFP